MTVFAAAEAVEKFDRIQQRKAHLSGWAFHLGITGFRWLTLAIWWIYLLLLRRDTEICS